MNFPGASPTPVARGVAILAALLSLPALVVPFVSFTWNTSPLDTIIAVFSGDEGWVFVLLGAPFFLGIPIVVAQITGVASFNITRAWRTVGFALAAFSTALSLTFDGMMALEMFEGGGSGEFSGYLVLILVPVILAIGAIWLWRTRQTAGATTRMTVALAAVYLANASYCLITFSDDRDLGWWLALVSSLGIALDAAQSMVTKCRTADAL